MRCSMQQCKPKLVSENNGGGFKGSNICCLQHPLAFLSPPASSCMSNTRSREKVLARRLRMLPVPSLEPVTISRQWDVTEHGETWRLIHPPLNHEATPFAGDPCQCWTWRRDLAVPGLALPPHSRLWGHRDVWGHKDSQPGRPRSTLEPLLCPEGRVSLVMYQTTPVLLRVSLFSPF